jgi:voltage-gated potassium channel Kch
VSIAQELRIPVIIGDGARSEMLRAAWVPDCRALVVLTPDDAGNLETALVGQAVKPDLRVVLRLFDGEMAGRVQRTFSHTYSRSVSYLAAPAFAAAMLGREVIGTIPVGPGRARLLAIRTGRGEQTLWSPPIGRRLVRTDRLIVVATRGGLSELLIRTTPAAEPAPRPPSLVEGPPSIIEDGVLRPRPWSE